MPSDLQIIDCFERLRDRFVREGPASVPAARLRPESTPPEAWVVEAWIQAMEQRPAASGAPQRRIRALSRAILDRQEGDPAPDALAAEPLFARAAAIPQALDRARRERLWPLTPLGAVPSPRAVGEEIVLWRKILPGLTGLRPWRFLERLGRPVVVPEAPVRRFLWRLGIYEDFRYSGQARHRMAHGKLEEISRLTGLEPVFLGALIRWLTVGEREIAGGRWCGAKPRCVQCPFLPGCLWARFHPEGASEAPSPERRALDPLRHQIAAGKLDQLQEIELLALLLQKGTLGLGVFELAETLMKRLGGMRGLDRASVAQLTQVKGISASRAVQLKAALELGRRVAVQAFQPGDPVTGSQEIWMAYRSRFRHLPQEHFVIVLLDAKNRVIHDHIVSKGTLTGSLAHPREVFQEAIRQAAAGVILLHNHPSGDPFPSKDDRAVTTRLREAGEILGIRVLDHVILGADDYYSFKDDDAL